MLVGSIRPLLRSLPPPHHALRSALAPQRVRGGALLRACGRRAGHTGPAAGTLATQTAWRDTWRARALVMVLGTGAGVGAVSLHVLWDNMRAEERERARPAPPPEVPETAPSGAEKAWQSTVRVVNDCVIEPVLVVKRFLVLAVLFGPVIVTLPLLLVGRRPRRTLPDGTVEHGDRWGTLWWYGFLVTQMERAGPTFVKLGQWAGSRHDLFSDALCNELSKLHSNNRPHSLPYTKRVLEHTFERPFDEIFEKFDEDPVGVGAVGQVYKAVLNPDLLPPSYLEGKDRPHHTRRSAAQQIGSKLALTYESDKAAPHVPTAAVAIKVLHPGVRRTIRHDIAIMRFFARAFDALPGMRWVSLPEEVATFNTLMVSQLDLRNEAQNLVRFEENFARRTSAVTFPRPLLPFCTRDVLVEEHIEAVPLKYFLKLGGLDYEIQIARLGLDAFLNMLLLDNFTHADLHPGNIMVKFYQPTTRTMLQSLLARILASFDADYVLDSRFKQAPAGDDEVAQELLASAGSKEQWDHELRTMEEAGYRPELVLLDAGLVSSLSETNRRNFLDLFTAVAMFDGRRAGMLMADRCRTPQLVTNKAQFVDEIEHIVDSVKSDTFSLSNLQIGVILSGVLRAVRQHHVKMEPDFVDTVLSILILEGIGRRLDANLDIFRAAIPILRSLGQNMSHGGEGGTAMPDQETMSSLMPVMKVWIYAEVRTALTSVVNPPPGLVDAFVRYGWFSE
ncbi:hypothetical protein MSPP1_002708 [Malassezia sp. CBS 17886]|nr:hypothetical protein MSPP1_002708 [Malassezia sp. CBS 17886]